MTGLSAALVWKAGLAHLVVTLPAGEHLNLTAPESLDILYTTGASKAEQPVVLGHDTGTGDLSDWYLRLPAAVPGAFLGADASFSVCSDDGSRCEPVRVFGVAPWVASGRAVLSPGQALIVTTSSPAPVDSRADLGSGVGNAGSGMQIYDFAAVWCPPCNLLAAEVLDRADYPGPKLNHVDVDSPDSWALKTKYKVGGYPTMVAVDGTGAEIARLVGYPGHDATRLWLVGLKDRSPVDARIAAAIGPAGSSADILALARELADAGDDRAAAVFAHVPTDAATLANPNFRITRLLLGSATAPDPADADWLFDQHAAGGDWVYAALEADPKLASRVPALVPGARGEDAAGWLDAAADVLPAGDLATAYRAGALAGLEAARAGDLQLDRGRLTDLAEMRAKLGNVPSAYALLDAASTRWPTEFTWPFVKARIALDANDLVVAEASARTALANSEGDQILRSAVALAKALKAEKRVPDAIAALDDALARVPAPPAAVTVRTTRYRNDAEKLRTELSAPAPTQKPAR